ncbi:MAG: hypothetical protein A2231_06550 [Candidatus Firestonebacteria bacterium RIFOXYA2_FULL_40_8]|nr:MAG: hypothetical protein A2231_06550 [Candidatus Firestonebacteria bacterium RIFOXYA2_FULL_40_8]
MYKKILIVISLLFFQTVNSYAALDDLSREGLSYVEWGTTTSYGNVTPTTTAPRWAQMHWIAGLSVGVTYHYRMVTIENGITTASSDQTFTTASISGAISLADIGGGTINCNQPNKTYVLTGDITGNGTAINITAAGVKLDLDGHTIKFGNNTSSSVYGVQISASNVTICNGKILQMGTGAAYSAAIAAQSGADGVEIFGIRTDVHLDNTLPIKLKTPMDNVSVHHNLLYSTVTEIESRHWPGNDLLRIENITGGKYYIFENILTKGCHRGITFLDGGASATALIYGNDIKHQMDYVNGYAVMGALTNAKIYHNRITTSGRAVHMTAPNMEVYNNWIDTTGNVTKDDMPQGSRPWILRYVELHGIKLEEATSKNNKIYNNFVRIIQHTTDSLGQYVPPTPLNIACYDANAMNEVYNNKFVGLTDYSTTVHNAYGIWSTWASAVFCVDMTAGPAAGSNYAVSLHDNEFISNDFFVGAIYSSPTSTIKFTNNKFVLGPGPTATHTPYYGLGVSLQNDINSNNTMNATESTTPMLSTRIGTGKWNYASQTSAVIYWQITSDSGTTVIIPPGEDPLANVKGFPNPCNINNVFDKKFKITSVPPGSDVEIFNSYGELIRKQNAADFGNSGRVSWDGKNTAGEDVPRGMYMYVVTYGTYKKIGKIGLLR